MPPKIPVKCENCGDKKLERTETEEGHAWVCPRFKRAERGKGCGCIISEERYAEMQREVEEELQLQRAAEEAAHRRAEQVHRAESPPAAVRCRALCQCPALLSAPLRVLPGARGERARGSRARGERRAG
jgi:hypothetical protein